MKTFIIFITLAASLTASAVEFKCQASQFPSDMQHFFSDGYTILKISKSAVNLKYYYVNTVMGQTTVEIDAQYELGGIQGGKGALKDMVIGTLVDSKSFPGDSIDTIHFSQSLFENTPTSGMVGKFGFSGAGYSYDWNVCYKK